MTEEEKQYLRNLKKKASISLKRRLPTVMRKYGEMLNDTDVRITDYVHNVVSHPNDHNLYELLKIKRFFTMLSKWKWNPFKAKLFIKHYENTFRFNSPQGRCHQKLTPLQVFQFCNILSFHRNDGRRVIRDVYIFVPRKFGKTTSMAGLVGFELLAGDANAEAYVGANSFDQAKKCFNEVRSLMQGIDRAGQHLRVNREMITFVNGERGSMAQCLTANAKTKDGLNASLVIMDEYAQARNTPGANGADLKNVLTTSMGARANPLTVVITTASDVIDGPFKAELDGVMKVLRGELVNDNIFADLFMPDVDDREDDPHTWAKVQPHIGVTVQPDYYRLEWQKAQLSAENLLAFRTKLLNVFAVNEAKAWFTPSKAQELIGTFDIDRVKKGEHCAISFDLSIRDDFSAVSYMIYRGQEKKFYCHTEYYFPEGALRGHDNEKLYREWVKDGYLFLCKGDRIDVDQIASDIMRRSRNLLIRRISYDSYKSQDLVSLLTRYDAGGQILQPFKQTYGEFNVTVEGFEMLAYAEKPLIEFNPNPINAYCLVNCTIDTDRLDNKKPIKSAPSKKIDGAITCLMSLGAIMKMRAEK